MLFLAHALIKVRENKLYIEKYSSFEEYYTNELNYRKQSVYNFIRIAESFPLTTDNEIVNLGVRKLLELSNPSLSIESRNNYIEENNLKSKSSAEIKQDVKDIITLQNNHELNEHSLIKDIKNTKPLLQSYSTYVELTNKEVKLIKHCSTSINNYLESFNCLNLNKPVEKNKLNELILCISNISSNLNSLSKLINKYID